MKSKVAISVVVVVVLLAGAYLFVTWNLNRSFRKANWDKLQTLIEAPLGEIVTASVAAKPGPAEIPYYQKHPGELQRDKNYFETWRSALTIARSMPKHEQGVEKWTRSTGVPWVPPSNRTDAWGHAFCVTSSPERIVVVSPGPQALASLDCGTLNITDTSLAKMVPGRLNVQPSGALVLVVARAKRSGQ